MLAGCCEMHECCSYYYAREREHGRKAEKAITMGGPKRYPITRIWGTHMVADSIVGTHVLVESMVNCGSCPFSWLLHVLAQMDVFSLFLLASHRFCFRGGPRLNGRQEVEFLEIGFHWGNFRCCGRSPAMIEPAGGARVVVPSMLAIRGQPPAYR